MNNSIDKSFCVSWFLYQQGNLIYFLTNDTNTRILTINEERENTNKIRDLSDFVTKPRLIRSRLKI